VLQPGALELPSLVEIRHHDARGDRRVIDLQALEKSKLLDLLLDDLLAVIDLCRGNAQGKCQESYDATEEVERATQAESMISLVAWLVDQHADLYGCLSVAHR
jgi:hypothetical protein